MKRLITFWVMLAAIAAVSTGCPPADTEPPKGLVLFPEAEMGYNWNYFEDSSTGEDIEVGTGCYYIALWNDETETELYLDFHSDFFKDIMQAYPASGPYTYADTHAKFTFNRESCYSTPTEDLLVTGGSFMLQRNSNGYYVSFDLVLENDAELKGELEGSASPFPSIGDVTLGLDEDNADIFAYAYESEDFEDIEGLWQINFEGELANGREVELYLMINAGTNITELPTGNFPMADEARAGAVGTAEPGSGYYDDDYDSPGCQYWHPYGYIMYAVPEEGFVNIGKNGNNYSIEFSFETPGGDTVSGSYTGPVYSGF